MGRGSRSTRASWPRSFALLDGPAVSKGGSNQGPSIRDSLGSQFLKLAK